MAARPEDKSWAETVDNLATMDSKHDIDEATFVENTDEEKKLVRKIDTFLMPTIWILYCFSYMVSVTVILKGSDGLYNMANQLGVGPHKHW
jgi:hypothetical protein